LVHRAAVLKDKKVASRGWSTKRNLIGPTILDWMLSRPTGIKEAILSIELRLYNCNTDQLHLLQLEIDNVGGASEP
jgi:hypothetical protein